MNQDIESPPTSEELASLAGNWLFFLIFGLVSVVAGFLAISATFYATMASVKVLGLLLLIAGVTEVVHAFMVRKLSGFALHLLSAALYLVVGLFMIRHPFRAAEVLTLLLGVSFVVGGLLRILFTLALRIHAWQWVVLHGVVDLVLGGLILNDWPESSLWVIGLFVGIDLVMHGWAWVILGLSVRSLNESRPA